MREIEIKVRLQDKEGLLAALAGKGVALGEPVHQRDQVFGLPGEAGGDPANYFTLRDEVVAGFLSKSDKCVVTEDGHTYRFSAK